MTVNLEIKGSLARLLATEDIIVEHKKVETACFNVQTRCLTLPLWEKASDSIYTMLVLHEISHALWTPNEDWSVNCKVPQQYVNIVEDARVEKLCKRKYQGSPKSFFNGYKELHAEDFFSIGDEDISKFSLADKVNLYFKIGNFIDLNFTAEEQEIVDLIAVAETFADVLIASEELYKYCKKQKEQEKIDNVENQKESGSSGDQSNDLQEKNEGENETNEASSPNLQQETNQSGSAKGDEVSFDGNKNQEEPELRTVDSLADNIKNLANMLGSESIYVEVPKVNLDTVIAKNTEIHKEIDTHFRHENIKHKNAYGESSDAFQSVDLEYRKFKTSAQKEVSYLVKEFECRKAADSYARVTTARTGVLDTSKLHSYMYCEDLFKKVSVLPDGKNHGLIFILDWSGSMSHVMQDTCKQLFNLIWFCRKVSIPFEVYAFTNEWNSCTYDYQTGKYIRADLKCHYTKKDGILSVDDRFALMNLLTSKVSGNELERQMVNIWRLAACFSNCYASKYSIPSRLSLSGTPLNESLICLHEIIPVFQKNNGLQKVHCIVLTDGESQPIPYHVEIKRGESNSYIGVRAINEKVFLRDRKLGTTYRFGYEYHKFTDTIIKNLKDKFTSVNFVGIRIIASKDASRFMSLYHNYDDQYRIMQNDWRKFKSFTITNSAYHAYFGLSSSALSQDCDFEVKESATKAQIKSAFVKSLKTKKLNKKVLGEFISLVV